MVDALKANDIAVVIPCYRVEKQIRWVVEHIPNYVRYIIAVNDASPDATPEILANLAHELKGKLIVVSHQVNQGVGGAMMTGYRTALQHGAKIIVKIDGDGQMNPRLLPFFVWPLVRGEAEYVKGNRFQNLADSAEMPKLRRLGNLGLSFLIRAASGYWNVSDPTNGYTAISSALARRLDFAKLEKRYLFESNLLVHAYFARARVIQVPMRAKYGEEGSSLEIRRIFFQLSLALVKWLFIRIFRTYFWNDFNVVSVFLFFGTLMTTFGLTFGAYSWIHFATEGIPATAGTVMLAAMPVLLGLEFLINALVLDVQNVPSSPPFLEDSIFADEIRGGEETFAP